MNNNISLARELVVSSITNYLIELESSNNSDELFNIKDQQSKLIKKQKQIIASLAEVIPAQKEAIRILTEEALLNNKKIKALEETTNRISIKKYASTNSYAIQPQAARLLGYQCTRYCSNNAISFNDNVGSVNEYSLNIIEEVLLTQLKEKSLYSKKDRHGRTFVWSSNEKSPFQNQRIEPNLYKDTPISRANVMTLINNPLLLKGIKLKHGKQFDKYSRWDLIKDLINQFIKHSKDIDIDCSAVKKLNDEVSCLKIAEQHGVLGDLYGRLSEYVSLTNNN